MQVTVPKGSLSHLTLDVNVGLPPDALYNIVTDPDNKRVFKNIKVLIAIFLLVWHKSNRITYLLCLSEYCICLYIFHWQEVISRKVLVDEGMRQVVEVEQAAIWKFLWWSGTISVHVLVDQNREDYTVQI